MVTNQDIATGVAVFGCTVLVLDKVFTLARGWQRGETTETTAKDTANASHSISTQLAVLQSEMHGLRTTVEQHMLRHDGTLIEIAGLKAEVAALKERLAKVETRVR